MVDAAAALARVHHTQPLACDQDNTCARGSTPLLNLRDPSIAHMLFELVAEGVIGIRCLEQSAMDRFYLRFFHEFVLFQDLWNFPCLVQPHKHFQELRVYKTAERRKSPSIRCPWNKFVQSKIGKCSLQCTSSIAVNHPRIGTK